MIDQQDEPRVVQNLLWIIFLFTIFDCTSKLLLSLAFIPEKNSSNVRKDLRLFKTYSVKDDHIKNSMKQANLFHAENIHRLPSKQTQSRSRLKSAVY
jgi:hypothetical protein